MNFNKLWSNYELFFHHEFIDDNKFPVEKKKLLQKDLGRYYIPNDFTIYQIKDNENEQITLNDYHDNYATVMIMLTNMPVFKAIDFIEFHYVKYPGDKVKFLRNVYNEFKGCKFSQGDKQLSPPMPFQMAMDWCHEKLNTMENLYFPKKKTDKAFINLSRIEELKMISSNDFDLTKLISLLEEINDNYAFNNFLSVAMLGRAILDHIAPVFGFRSFNEVANNYGSASFKKNMSHLNNSMRSIADNFLHSAISKKEVLPNENQIDFSREFDYLLTEIQKRLT